MPLRLPDAKDCYFCDIINGRMERWNVITESALTLTLLDGRQFETGQCLVVPKRHAATILDLTDDEAISIIAVARKLANVIMDALDPDGLLLYQNNGVASGQEVPHFHLHVVPRRPDSDWGLGPPHIARLENGGHRPDFDHSKITDAKRQTARTIRRFASRHEVSNS